MPLYQDATWFLAHEQGAPAGPRLISICREIARRQQTLITNSEKCLSLIHISEPTRRTPSRMPSSA